MNKSVVIITGAAGGIGMACVDIFAESNHLVLSDVSKDKLSGVAKIMRQKGFSVDVSVGDISSEDYIDQLIELSLQAGDIKTLIHTAGLSPMMADSKRIYEVNLLGTAHLLKKITPHMSNGATAVCIASQAGIFAQETTNPDVNELLENPLQSNFLDELELKGGQVTLDNAYGYSKLGVQLLIQKYAPIWGLQNARLVSISPGIIDTPMGQFEKERQPIMDVLIKKSPLGRMGRPAETAKAVCFMASKDASFITGVDLLVDGGATHTITRMAKSGEVELPDKQSLN